jgi:hypothetical protein
VWLARLVLVAALAAGVPPFLRMPPWCDATLYDLAARNLLAGGVHYRDIFDTNMPGFVWAVAAVRAALGWSTEALRAVDLLVVAGAVAVLDRLAARAGAGRAARAWAVAGAAVYYPFTSEFNHCQRDVWMMLPALKAVALRLRGMTNDECPTNDEGMTNDQAPMTKPERRLSSRHRSFGFPSSFVIQGALWGLAVWVKPHAVVPAAVVWLLTAPRVFAAGGRRAVVADLLGNLAGGLLVGAAGVAYLVLSGTWSYFVEVFTDWNAGYAAAMWAELPERFAQQLAYFPPWSYLQLLSLPVAVLCVLDARPWAPRSAGPGPVGRRLPGWLWDPAAGDAVRSARLILAAVYLGWTAQALFTQRGFHYVHVPETLMLLFLLATQRWPAGFVMTAWLVATSAAVLAGPVEPANVTGVGPPRGPGWAVLHPAADLNRAKWWADCWRADLPAPEYRRRRDGVGLIHTFHSANDWEQLGEVADWLRGRGVRDGELLCWDDAPHALYLELGVRPAFRFLHVGQMTGLGPEQEVRVRTELCGVPRPRWAVSDLLRLEAVDPAVAGRLTDAGPDRLPTTLPGWARREFPYDQPAIFRSGGGRGRYVVHELRRPIPWCDGNASTKVFP